MTAVVEAVVLIAFVFVMGLIFGFLVAMIFGRRGRDLARAGAAGVPRPADSRPDPKVTGSGPAARPGAALNVRLSAGTESRTFHSYQQPIPLELARSNLTSTGTNGH